MAKLKVFITQSGFFEFVVAAASMKAAIKSLGISSHAFKRGFAKQTQDKSIIAVATAKPGLVLQRPVGTKKEFTVNALLPEIKSGKKLPREKVTFAKAQKISKTKAIKDKRQLLLERAKANQAERIHKQSLAKFQKAEKRHKAILQGLNEEGQRLAQKLQAEEIRWTKEKARFPEKL